MPEISKINALAIGSVGKVDGLAKASILDIDGVTVPTGLSYTPPLDTYTGAAAAYSVRLLRTAYTGNCLRVRRDSDNTEQDFGFTSAGLVDTSAISTFVGSGNNGYLRYWYDQSGNSNDAGQSTAASQPKIYDATTGLITENSNPAIRWDGLNDVLLTGNVTYSADYGQDFVVGSVDGTNDDGILTMYGVDGGPNLMMNIRTVTTKAVRMIRGAGLLTSVNNVWTANTQHLFNAENNPSNQAVFYVDGTSVLSGAGGAVTGTSKAAIGTAFGTSADPLLGNLQEIIIYNQYNSGYRTGLETNIDGYFLIPGL